MNVAILPLRSLFSSFSPPDPRPPTQSVSIIPILSSPLSLKHLSNSTFNPDPGPTTTRLLTTHFNPPFPHGVDSEKDEPPPEQQEPESEQQEPEPEQHEPEPEQQKLEPEKQSELLETESENNTT